MVALGERSENLGLARTHNLYRDGVAAADHH